MSRVVLVPDANDERILARWPTPIARAWLRLLDTIDDDGRVLRLVDVIVQTVDLFAIVAMADLAHQWPVDRRPQELLNRARRLLVKPQLGELVGLVRDWLDEAKKRRPSVILGHPTDESLSEFIRRLNEFPELRNTCLKRRDATQHRLKDNAWLHRAVAQVRDALIAFESVGDVALVTQREDTAAVTLRGAFVGPLPAGDLVFEPGCTAMLTSPFTAPLVLDPLVVSRACVCGQCAGRRTPARLEWPRKDSAHGRYHAITDAHPTEEDAEGPSWQTFGRRLSTDWEWQRDGRLKDYPLRALRYDVALDVENHRGDTRNRHRILVERILADWPGSDSFGLDYHDQMPPVSDEVFALSVRDATRGEDCPVDERHREVWHDAFRSFSVRFATPLELGEQRVVDVSMFEPGLFERKPQSLGDYYEFCVHLPVDQLSLVITLPHDAEVDAGDLSLDYLEESAERLDSKGARLQRAPDGRAQVAFEVTKPKLHANIVVRFSVTRWPTQGQIEAEPWYWAANRVYRLLESEPERSWTLREVAELLRERSSH